MKLTNIQVLALQGAMEGIVQDKLIGPVKFKLFKILKAVNSEKEAILSALEFDEKGYAKKGSESNLAVYQTETELDLPTLTEQELAEVPLSIMDLDALNILIKEEEK